MDGFAPPAAPQPQAQTYAPEHGGMMPPPPPGGAGPAGGLPSFGPAPQDQGNKRPPGRPALDPDREAQRRASAAERERFARLLPKAATDARILVYRGKGTRGVQHQPTPVLRILLSDIEESGDDPQNFITQMIQEKFPDGGHFVCEPKDKNNRLLPDSSIFDIDVPDESGVMQHLSDEEEYEDEELEVFEDPVTNDTSLRRPPFGYGQVPGYPDEPAPAAWRPPGTGAPPAIKEDPLASYQAIKNMVKQEQSESSMMMQLWMQMDQTRREDERRRDELRHQEEARREELARQMEDRRERERRQDEERERARHEEMKREERERRDNLWKALIAGLPAALGVMAKLFEKKEDPTMPLLLKMLDNSNDRSAVKDMIAMTNESAKQQMGLQSELTKVLMETQGQASSSMLNNVMQMMMQASQAQIEAMGGESDDWTEKMGKIMKIVSPVIEGMSHSQVPQVPGPQVAPAVQQAVTGEQRRQAQAQSQEQAQAAQPQLTEQQATRAVLHTIRSLENGDAAFLDAGQRLQAIQWVAENLPAGLRQAVIEDREDDVIEAAAPVVMADGELIAWFSRDGATDFVRTVLQQVRGILEGHTSQLDALRVLYFHRNYLRQKGVDLVFPAGTDLDAALQEAETAARQAPAEGEGVSEETEDTDDDGDDEIQEGSRVRCVSGPNAGSEAQVMAVLDGGYHLRLDDGQEVPCLPEHLELIESAEDEDDEPEPPKKVVGRRPPPPPAKQDAPTPDDEEEAEEPEEADETEEAE